MNRLAQSAALIIAIVGYAQCAEAQQSIKILTPNAEISPQKTSAPSIRAPMAPYKIKPEQSVSPWLNFGVFNRLPGTVALGNETVTLTPPAEIPIAPPTRSSGSDAGAPPFQEREPNAEVFFAPD